MKIRNLKRFYKLLSVTTILFSSMACSLNTMNPAIVKSTSALESSEAPTIPNPMAEQPTSTPIFKQPEPPPMISPAIPVVSESPDTIISAPQEMPATNYDNQSPDTDNTPVVKISPVDTSTSNLQDPIVADPQIAQSEQIGNETLPSSGSESSAEFPTSVEALPPAILETAAQIAQVKINSQPSEEPPSSPPVNDSSNSSQAPSISPTTDLPVVAAEPIITTTPPQVLEYQSSESQASDSQTNETATNNEDDAEKEMFVAGSCNGRKKAGVIWYHKSDSKKKGESSTNCKNDKFEFKLKFKKKDAEFILLQTVFY